MIQRNKPATECPKDRLKRRLLLQGVLLMPVSASHAQDPTVQCPGKNTVEMRYCAGVSWEESTAQLQRKIPKALFQQWQSATRALCAHAYGPYEDGTIYPQLVVDCDDNLNRALLREFQPLNNQGDPERLP